MIYVDALLQWGAAGQYRGEHAAQAERVGARNDHRWCHLFADEADCEELHAFARRLGMRREWFQGDHYDLVLSRRNMAVAFGAKQVAREEAVAIWRAQEKSK